MNIIWYGQSCFQIIVQKIKDNPVKIVIDPLEQGIGLKAPKLEADILLKSSAFAQYGDVQAQGFLIDKPGEYDIKDVFVQGISCINKEDKNKDIIIYIIEAEGIRICDLGRFNKNELSDSTLEKIVEADILILPIGGANDGGIISSEQAVRIIKQVDPRIVIPMFYKIPGLTVKLENQEKFLKAMTQKTIEAQDKLSIKKKNISDKGVEIALLKP
ncbi:MAG: MBL fold metallo-hydrolase [Patescibacteria group bacterium]|nr:MBL fold metallo-hydrolase [Patescibacteria group bacterium]